MAIWQFALDLIRATAACVGGIDAIWMSPAQLDAAAPRLPPEGLPGLFAGLALLLPEKEPWVDALCIWGDESSHDVQFWFYHGGIENIQFGSTFAVPIPPSSPSSPGWPAVSAAS